MALTDEDRNQIDGYLKCCEQLMQQFQLGTVGHRLERFRADLRSPGFGIADAHAQLRVLREAVQHDVSFLYFHHYPHDKAMLLLRVTTDWTRAIGAFSALKAEIEAAIDCYAFGHNLGCVFYLMRVMEQGIERFATKTNQ